jgi:hypothetical protein
MDCTEKENIGDRKYRELGDLMNGLTNVQEGYTEIQENHRTSKVSSKSGMQLPKLLCLVSRNWGGFVNPWGGKSREFRKERIFNV